MHKYSEASLNALFTLVTIGLTRKVEDHTNLEDKFSFIDWQSMRRLAIMHGLSGFVRDGINLLKKENLPLPPKKFFLDIGVQAMQAEKQFLRQWQAAVALSKEWEEAGLQTNVIKGFSIASLYPHPKSRQCGDLDCFLTYQESEKEKKESAAERGNLIVEEQGIAVDRSIHLHSTFEYMGLQVENHSSLTETRGNERAQRFEDLLQQLLIEDGTTQIKQEPLWAPKMMFNALYLTYHGQKHLLREQMSLKQVVDWAMAERRIYRKPEEFDWNRFWKYCEEFGMLNFAETMCGLAERICGIPMPEGKTRNAEEENTLLHFIIDKDLACEESGPRWWRRLKLIRRILSYRDKYRHFSDHSAWAEVRQVFASKFNG